MDWKRLPCFEHLNWNPSARDLRTFGISMVVGFAVIGLIVAWRHQGIATPTFVLWGVGAALAVASQIPGLGHAAYLLIYIVSGVLGYVLSRVILTVLYVLLFVPIGLGLRVAGKDPLHLRSRPHAAWLRRGPPAGPSSYYRAF